MLSRTPPRPRLYYPLSTDAAKASPLVADSVTILEYETSLITDTVIIDFAQRQIAFRRVDEFGNVVWEYTYDELNRYIQSRQEYVFSQLWYQSHAAFDTKDAGKDKKGDLLEWEMPVHYPKWARRVLGDEPPKLSIHGYEEISLNFESSNFSREGTNDEGGGNTSPVFKNDYNITVNGSVGRLIDVNLESSSDQGQSFENPLKKIKIEYKGEGDELEDEIVQEVTAGYTSFNFPGGRLSGYSQGSHEGLFGISSKMKFGPLDVTAAVSNEQGEALEKTFNPNQASDANEKRLGERDYVKYRFFFLDTVYLRAYNTHGGTDYARHVPEVQNDIQLWKQLRETEFEQQNKEATGLFRMVRQAGQYDDKIFKRLEKGEDYFVDQRQGWIRFEKNVVDKNTVIGVYMNTTDPSVVPDKGDTTLIDSVEKKSVTLSVMDSLWILKGKLSDAPDERIDPGAASGLRLMWKNVYDLPDFEGDFDLKVEWIPKTGDDTRETAPSSAEKLSTIMGLTDKDGKIIDEAHIFDKTNGFIFIPPFDTAVTPVANQPFKNKALGGNEFITPVIYDSFPTAKPFREHIDMYNLVLEGEFSQKKTSFNLGWGVIEGSEEVTADGQVLVKNDDYEILYDIGELRLLSPTATSATTIKVTYQRETFAAFKNKLFMGLSGELALPAVSDQSFIGGSVLYQVTSTREEIPSLGQETFNKLLLDFNTTFDFTPEWMTSAVDLLPGISTEDESSLTFEFEAAHSRWQHSADSKGQAYIDDFESSQNTFVLGMDHRQWNTASTPADFIGDTTVDGGIRVPKSLYHPPAWDAYWFSPRDDEEDAYTVRKEEILDIDERTRQQTATGGYEPQNEPILRLVCRPASDSLAGRYHDPWCGVMRGFGEYANDRREDKYLKLFVQVSDATGKLHIDMGELSEDVSIHGGPPNGRFDDEDTIGVEDYEPTCNTGLDNVGEDQNEFYVIPNSDLTAWDTLRFGDARLPYPDDPARDNYQPYTDGGRKSNRNRANGLQNDEVLSSEDLNGDGFTTDENLFRFTISLDSIEQSAYIDTSVSTINNWHCLRIPLDSLVADSIIGSPTFRKITHVRMWWNDFEHRKSDVHELVFYNMEFVGNKWEEMPTRDLRADTTLDTVQIDASVINNIDNTNTFIPSEPVEKDRYGNPKREQALRLNYYSVAPGHEVMVKKERTHPWNFSSYSGITFNLYGMQDHVADSVYFFYRFGTGPDRYYEYRTRIVRGWDKNARIDFTQLSRAKLELLKNPFIDSVDTMWRAPGPGNDAHYRIYSSNENMPSFASVRYMAMGVYVDSSEAGEVTGEVWIDKLKVTNLRQTHGSAALFSMSSGWADFMNINANLDYRDGDFRQMNESSIEPKSSSFSQNVNAEWRLHKFMPAEWKVNVPLNVRMSHSLDRPQLKPGSDIPLTKENGEPDRLRDMLLETETPSSHFETMSNTRSASISYRKTSYSKNLLSNLTLDRLSVGNVRYQKDVTTEHKGARKNSDRDYLNYTQRKNYTGNVAYDLGPKKKPAWSSWSPFEPYAATPVLGAFSDYSFQFVPDKLTFDLIEARYNITNKEHDKPALQDVTQQFRLDHGMHLSYSPIDPLLDISYDISTSRDLDEAVASRRSWSHFMQTSVTAFDRQWREYSFLYGEDRRSQNARFTLRPAFVKWFTQELRYSTDFTADMAGQDSTYGDFGVKSTFDFESTLRLSNLFDRLAGDKAARKQQSDGPSLLQFFFDGFRTLNIGGITFNYKGISHLSNKKVYTYMMDRTMRRSMAQFMSYQFGFKGRGALDIISGDMPRDVFGGMDSRKLYDREYNWQNDTRTMTRSYDISTRFSIPDPVDVDITTLKIGREYTYDLFPYPLDEKKAVTFPELTVSAKTELLNKAPGIKKNLKNVDVNSSYEFSRRRNHERVTHTSDNNDVDTVWRMRDEDVLHDFAPLFRLGGTLQRWPIKISVADNYSVTIKTAQQMTKDTEHEQRIEADYTFHRNPENKTLNLVFWDIPLEGKVTARLAGSHKMRVNATKDIDKEQDEGGGSETSDQEWKENEKIRTIDFNPSMSYSFTRKITGRTELSYATTHEILKREKRSNFVFGMSVKVTF